MQNYSSQEGINIGSFCNDTYFSRLALIFLKMQDMNQQYHRLLDLCGFISHSKSSYNGIIVRVSFRWLCLMSIRFLSRNRITQSSKCAGQKQDELLTDPLQFRRH